MNGKLVVIEGIDGSGKATQTQLLYDKIKEQSVPIKKITFPNYEDESSALVKMYLRGEFGNNINDTNCFAASTFFSVDRYASYHKFWKKDYDNGTLILSDRYTTANMVHQTAKLPKEKWSFFLDWLYDFEYVKLELPEPTVVIYLDMSPSVSKKLLLKRYKGDKTKEDIHEANIQYTILSREVALLVAKKYNWIVIKCDDGENPYTQEEINNKIYDSIKSIL